MLEQIIICSLCITFIHVCFWDGMILSALRTSFLRHLSPWVRKPIYECLICMSVWYGFIYYCLVFPHGAFNVTEVITFLFAVAGLNTVAYGIIGNAENFNGEKFVNDGGGVSGYKYSETDEEIPSKAIHELKYL